MADPVVLRERIETLPVEDAALWSEVQAASFRSPEIATLMRTMDETVRDNVVKALVRIHGDGSANAVKTFETRAHLMMLLIHGFAQRKFCAREASQILGGASYIRGNRVERFYREVRVNAIGGGSEEIMRDLAARQYKL